MKKAISLGLAILFTLSLTSCGKQDRILYNGVKLSKITEICDYKGIEVDTSSDSFKDFYEDVLNTDIEDNKLYVKKTEGKVADGDTVNIDYEGKKDGAAFDGGTAEGADLVIGSNTFIDGFEDGLIGVSIGDTVDLKLTFPENYGNEELNGAKVVFTVKVNYITTDEQRKSEDYYAELGFDTHELYLKDAEKRATENFLYDYLCENSKVKEYPEEDIEIIYTSMKNTIEMNLNKNYSMDFESYLNAQNTTEEEFKKEFTENQIKPLMDNLAVLYAVADKEKLTVSSDEMSDKIKEIADLSENAAVTEEYIKEMYGEYNIESQLIYDKVIDFVYTNAKIK